MTRTMEGPFCEKCLTPIYQAGVTQHTGYVKWMWIHEGEHCGAINVWPTWRVREQA